MKAGAGTPWASRPAMLRPARIAVPLLVAVVLGLGVGYGIHRLTAGTAVTIDGQGGPVVALPFRQEHGDIASLGFRFGKLAYSADLSGLPQESIAALANLDVWIVDALRYRPHPSHFSLDDALTWIERLKPRRAILTNLHADLDYEVLRGKLPVHVVPAFDGMTFAVSESP
jgi:phosphoribosyl 1,2-cyclic phosphate phosphodiesterase